MRLLLHSLPSPPLPPGSERPVDSRRPQRRPDQPLPLTPTGRIGRRRRRHTAMPCHGPQSPRPGRARRGLPPACPALLVPACPAPSPPPLGWFSCMSHENTDPPLLVHCALFCVPPCASADPLFPSSLLSSPPQPRLADFRCNPPSPVLFSSSHPQPALPCRPRRSLRSSASRRARRRGRGAPIATPPPHCQPYPTTGARPARGPTTAFLVSTNKRPAAAESESE